MPGVLRHITNIPARCVRWEGVVTVVTDRCRSPHGTTVSNTKSCVDNLLIPNGAGLVEYRAIELESWSRQMGILSPQSWLTQRKLPSQDVWWSSFNSKRKCGNMQVYRIVVTTVEIWRDCIWTASSVFQNARFRTDELSEPKYKRMTISVFQRNRSDTLFLSLFSIKNDLQTMMCALKAPRRIIGGGKCEIS
jgi:hypothetical protein